MWTKPTATKAQRSVEVILTTASQCSGDLELVEQVNKYPISWSAYIDCNTNSSARRQTMQFLIASLFFRCRNALKIHAFLVTFSSLIRPCFMCIRIIRWWVVRVLRLQRIAHWQENASFDSYFPVLASRERLDCSWYHHLKIVLLG